MANKSWHLHRRTFLRGTGAMMALPLLESMTHGRESTSTDSLPRRLCCFYFPFGVPLKGEWAWWPTEDGKDFAFSKTLASLEPFRDHVTITQGLSHGNVQSVPGHDSGDSFLTGVPVKAPNYSNGVSLDQVAAAHSGRKTRFASLVLSSDGGVGEPTRTRTISYNREGKPIPAMSEPDRIFRRLFGVPTETERKRMARNASLLDRVLENSKSLRLKLGRHDQRKLDEYLESVRSVEKNIQSSRDWAKTARPQVDPASVNLNVALDQDPDNFLKTMYDLIFLAVQTDSTRITAYQIGQNLTTSLACNRLPQAVGLGNWHGLGHGQNKKPEAIGRMQEYVTGHLSRFMKKLQETSEADGSLLDRTVILHGSTNAATHGTNNYPLILAGGGRLGLRHGQYLDFRSKTNQRCSNLYLAVLQSLGVPSEEFADSTAPMSEVLA